MTAQPLSPRTPSGQRPDQQFTLANVRDLTDTVLFYGILSIGLFGPICLAVYSELFR